MAKPVIPPMPVIAAEMRQTPLLRNRSGRAHAHATGNVGGSKMGIIGLLVVIILVILLLRLI